MFIEKMYMFLHLDSSISQKKVTMIVHALRKFRLQYIGYLHAVMQIYII